MSQALEEWLTANTPKVSHWQAPQHCQETQGHKKMATPTIYTHIAKRRRVICFVTSMVRSLRNQGLFPTVLSDFRIFAFLCCSRPRVSYDSFLSKDLKDLSSWLEIFFYTDRMRKMHLQHFMFKQGDQDWLWLRISQEGTDLICAPKVHHGERNTSFGICGISLRAQTAGTSCWWKKSCTTWDVENLVNNGINFLSTCAGFQPWTVVKVKSRWHKSCVFAQLKRIGALFRKDNLQRSLNFARLWHLKRKIYRGIYWITVDHLQTIPPGCHSPLSPFAIVAMIPQAAEIPMRPNDGQLLCMIQKPCQAKDSSSFPRQQLVTPSTFVAAVEQNEDFTWYKLDDPKPTESCKTYDHLVTLLAVFSFLYSKYLYQFGYTWCEPVNSWTGEARPLWHQTHLPNTFYIGNLSQTKPGKHQLPFGPDLLTRKTFYAKRLLHQKPFTTNTSCTKFLLHLALRDLLYIHQKPSTPAAHLKHFTPNNFLHQIFLHQEPFTADPFYTKQACKNNPAQLKFSTPFQLISFTPQDFCIHLHQAILTPKHP